MKTTNYRHILPVQNPHGIEARKIHDNEKVQTVHITLQPGEKLIKHSTLVDVFFYVLEGAGTVEIGDDEKEVSVDDLIDSPANIPHGWFNNNNSILRFLVVKTPRPSDSQNREAVLNILKNR